MLGVCVVSFLVTEEHFLVLIDTEVKSEDKVRGTPCGHSDVVSKILCFAAPAALQLTLALGLVSLTLGTVLRPLSRQATFSFHNKGPRRKNSPLTM